MGSINALIVLSILAAVLKHIHFKRRMHQHSNLFVKNIPKEINEAVLRSLFQTYGCVVSCRILKSRYEGSNNVGFVKFSSLEEAKLAIDYMHLATIENVVIEVRFADQDVGEKRAAEAKEGTRQDCARVQASKTLYVKGFPRAWREEDLMDYFSNFGTVLRARVLNSRETGGRGGKVTMASIDEASMSVNILNGRIPLGGENPLSVTFAHPEALPSRVKKEPNHETRPKRKPPPSGKSASPLGTVLTQAAIQSSNLCPVIGHRFRLERDDTRTPKQDSANSTPGYRYASSSLPPVTHSMTKQENDLEESSSHARPEASPKTSLYIRNLPHDVDELRLYQLFGHFGGVHSVKRLPDRECAGRGGVGFVNYVDNASAARASIEMNGLRISKNVLIVSLQAHPTYNR